MRRAGRKRGKVRKGRRYRWGGGRRLAFVVVVVVVVGVVVVVVVGGCAARRMLCWWGGGWAVWRRVSNGSKQVNDLSREEQFTAAASAAPPRGDLRLIYRPCVQGQMTEQRAASHLYSVIGGQITTFTAIQGRLMGRGGAGLT